jgi:hypothetical protein
MMEHADAADDDLRSFTVIKCAVANEAIHVITCGATAPQ